jgi:hypothetical protein
LAYIGLKIVRRQLSRESKTNPVFEITLRVSQHTNISSTEIPGKKASREYETARFRGGDFSCGWKGDAARQESIPQGLKPLFLCCRERPKAKALGYLEAKATTTAKATATAGPPPSAKDDN